MQKPLRPDAEKAGEWMSAIAARAVDASTGLRHTARMSTLAEIEAAADALPPEEKQELFLFLAVRLREGRVLPEPRDFPKDEMEAWVAEDEADMESFRRGE